MKYHNTHITDSIGNNFLGIKINKDLVNPFLDELKDILETEYDEFVNYQQRRDHGSYHITVLNVIEYNKLIKEMGMDKFVSSLDIIFKYEIDDLKMMGLGTAEKNGNRSYFVVCKSDKLNSIRKRYNLDEKDLHITLGFRFKDVSGVSKNEVIKKETKFLKLLRQEFNKDDNWNFVKNISNFDLDIKSELIPISISDTSMLFKCQNYYINITWLESSRNFWITNKYPVDVDLPRLPETEISKIINK
jgi:hypothetical protein